MMAGVAARVSMIALLFQISHNKGVAKLLTTPLDTEVKVNDSVYLNCSTSDWSLEIHWKHNGNHVYAGARVYSPYYGRFHMMRRSIGEYNLFIPSVKPEDAGRYECRDNEGSGQSHSAELTVLAAEPFCASNVKPDGIVGPNTCNVEPEEVQFSCSVAFYGQPPKMEWSSLENQNPLSNVSCESNGRQLTCNVTMESGQNLDGSLYVCQTTRATSEQYKCITEAIKILYFTRNFVVMEKALNDNVLCSVNSSLQLYNFTWKITDGDREIIVANNQTHQLNTSGLYRCDAEYSLRNASCHDMVALVYVHNPVTGPIAEKGTECTVYTSMMVVFILAFVAAIFTWFICVKKKNKRRRNKGEDIELLNPGTITDDLETQLARKNTDIEFYKAMYQKTKAQLQQTRESYEDKINQINNELELHKTKNRELEQQNDLLTKDLELHKTKNRELEQQIELLTKDLELHEKKIEKLEEKHVKQRFKWKEEKKVLVEVVLSGN